MDANNYFIIKELESGGLISRLGLLVWVWPIVWSIGSGLSVFFRFRIFFISNLHFPITPAQIH